MLTDDEAEVQKLREIVRVHTNRVKGCLCEACSDAERLAAEFEDQYKGTL